MGFNSGFKGLNYVLNLKLRLITILLVCGLGVEDRQIGIHELPPSVGGVEPQ